MAIDDITNPEWVRLAIAEYNDSGPQAFLDNYGFRKSTKFDLLDDDGKRYPPKAILAVAHKFKSARAKALTSHDLNGGEPTNGPLRKLGFRVVAKAIIAPESSGSTPFDPTSVADARRIISREIRERRGQAKFRKALISAYSGRCAISGSAVLDVLEAAHIFPYLGEETNNVTNGVLLRADLHTLFDLNLIGINPDTLAVYVSPELAGSEYDKFQDRSLSLPSDDRKPSVKALRKRWEEIVGE